MSYVGTQLSERMKYYEGVETGPFPAGLPIIVRVDGVNFSRYTERCEKPYDAWIGEAMQRVTSELVRETHAVVGYTQSDEISLVLHAPSGSGEHLHFGGKRQKIVSRCAAFATAVFNAKAPWLAAHSGLYAPPQFDCRAHVVPNLDEAANYLYWRYMDATNNAVSQAASCMFSHEELHGRSHADRREMLDAAGHSMIGHPEHFRFGLFYKRAEDATVRRLSDVGHLYRYSHAERVRLLLGPGLAAPANDKAE